jgi:hypothetical protein
VRTRLKKPKDAKKHKKDTQVVRHHGVMGSRMLVHGWLWELGARSTLLACDGRVVAWSNDDARFSLVDEGVPIDVCSSEYSTRS